MDGFLSNDARDLIAIIGLALAVFQTVLAIKAYNSGERETKYMRAIISSFKRWGSNSKGNQRDDSDKVVMYGFILFSFLTGVLLISGYFHITNEDSMILSILQFVLTVAQTTVLFGYIGFLITEIMDDEKNANKLLLFLGAISAIVLVTGMQVSNGRSLVFRVLALAFVGPNFVLGMILIVLVVSIVGSLWERLFGKS